MSDPAVKYLTWPEPVDVSDLELKEVHRGKMREITGLLTFQTAFRALEMLPLIPSEDPPTVENIETKQAIVDHVAKNQGGEVVCMEVPHLQALAQALYYALNGNPGKQRLPASAELHERLLPWQACFARATSQKPKAAKDSVADGAKAVAEA
jgi:hypothetical protein